MFFLLSNPKQNNETDVPISEEEWGKLKGLMGEVLKDTENATIKYLPQSLLTDPTIIDEKVIAMPTMYNYVSKHRGVYANKIATMKLESAPVNPEEGAQKPTQEEAQVLETNPQETAPSTQQVVEPTQNEQEEQTSIIDVQESEINNPALESIDINSIEEKYNKMVEDINNLKTKEIEAAKRYNATLELNAMHNAQHASYVQSEQTTVLDTPAPSVEPTPIVATPIEPQMNSVDIETNWFDMPQ